MPLIYRKEAPGVFHGHLKGALVTLCGLQIDRGAKGQKLWVNYNEGWRKTHGKPLATLDQLCPTCYPMEPLHEDVRDPDL